MFFPGYLSILRGGVEALVAQVLMEQSWSITRIIQFHGVHGKGMPQPMRTDVMDSTGFRIVQFWQASSFRALGHDLPGPVTIYAKNQLPPIPNHRATVLQLFVEQLQGIVVDGKDPLPSTFLLLNLNLVGPAATVWTECMGYAQFLSAHGAGQLWAGFEMFNCYCTMGEVNIL